MSKTIQAGLVYFAIVLGTGFLLGVVRVLFLVPRIGERWAELAEMPIMATVIYFAAGFILNRFPDIKSPSKSLIAGVLALTLSVGAELALATILQDRTLAEFIATRDKVSGSVYLVLLVVFAVMPRLLLARQVKHASARSEAQPFAQAERQRYASRNCGNTNSNAAHVCELPSGIGRTGRHWLEHQRGQAR